MTFKKGTHHMLKYWIVLHVIVPYLVQRSSIGWTALFPSHQLAIRQHLRAQRAEQLRGATSHLLLSTLQGTHTSYQSRLQLFCRTVDTFSSNSCCKFVTWIQMKWYPQEDYHNVMTQLKHKIKVTLLLLSTLHLARFYTHGYYFLWSKRLVTLTNRMKSGMSSRNKSISYRLIGYLMYTRLFLSLVQSLVDYVKARQMTIDRSRPENFVVPSALDTDTDTLYLVFPPRDEKCALCLESLTYSTMTPCGHVFDWDCIVKWCQKKNECPNCRATCHPQALRCLYGI